MTDNDPQHRRWSDTTGIVVADLLFTLVTGVWGFAEPLIDEKRTALLVTGIVATATAGLIALGFTVARARRRTPGRTVAVVAVMALVLVGLGGAGGYLGRRLGTRVGPPVTIEEPADGTRAYPDQLITLAVTYNVLRAGPEFCAGHLWLIDQEPSGGNGRILFVARQELPCREGRAQARFLISTQWSHHLTVYRLDETDQQRAVDNLRRDRVGDATKDGDIVRLPVSASIESNDVHIVLRAG